MAMRGSASRGVPITVPWPGVTHRFESKYAVTYPGAESIKEFLRPHMLPDPAALEGSDGVYEVVSLYLDSPDFGLCEATILGKRNRYKLRVRRYGVGPVESVYFEIKSRRDQILTKDRAKVRPDRADGILSGRPPTAEDLVEPDPRAVESLKRFRDHMDEIGGVSRCWVRYRRHAFVARDYGGAIRVTFDTNVTAAPATSVLEPPDSGWIPSCEHPVIMEIKFTDTIPGWLHRALQVFGLRRESIAKYVMGVKALTTEGVLAGGRIAWRA